VGTKAALDVSGGFFGYSLKSCAAKEQQIPGGNDRKKSKDKSKGSGKSRSFAALRMTNP